MGPEEIINLITQNPIVLGGLALTVGMGGIIALIVFARLFIRLSRRESKNAAWQQLGYRSQGATRYGRGSVGTHYVRTYSGHEIHYRMHVKSSFGKSQSSAYWTCEIPVPSSFGLQVIEAGIADSSLAAKASRALDRHTYDWKAHFDTPIETGDAALDNRFTILGTDAGAAQQFLLGVDIGPVLLALPHVDLTVANSEARFDDTFLANVWGKDGTPLVEIHDQIAQILTKAVEMAASTPAQNSD
ncbi:MAG: hypothetical protein DWQ07_19290 [Chloroflexi bacterium]|nr:MAG: hypothetical protein DWQ07_19290 [Chloroflexota bacterium]MBL1195078.1 hypothetical protein [Chloroflexota bacterium]NOH12365.1 hypothetical protein [Chloroflexota bacterium]